MRGSGQKRILYIDMAPSVGGSIVSLYQLLKGLDRTRYEPSVVLRTGHAAIPQFQALGIKVYTVTAGYTGAMASASPRWSRARKGRLAGWLRGFRTGRRLVQVLGFYLRTWPELRREARALREVIAQAAPDLVHLNDVVSVCRSGILAARAARVPAICHLRALAERTHYDRWLSHSLRGYICISQAVDRYQREQGGRTDPSWVVYNGLDVAEYEASPEAAALTREAIRRELGFAPTDVVIGCVGRLRPWKGQHVLLRALARLAPRYPPMRGLVVGSPERHEERYRDELVGLAQGLHLEQIVSFIGFRDDVPRLMRAMDLMVHASVAPEPFGRVVIESMAAGTPVLATNAGAIPEIVQDRVTGLLVRPNDEAAMAEAIAFALDHPEQRAAWARAARQEVSARFALEGHVQGVQAVYEEVLS